MAKKLGLRPLMIGACFSFAVITVLVGCGSDGGNCAVSGKISSKGKPLVCGTVNFLGPKGETAAGAIEADGTFFCPNAPTGVVKIGVVSEKPVVSVAVGKPGRAAPPPPPGPDVTKWFPIDAKYADPNTSGKQITLKSGSNTVEIELE
jgi:hypothetical protein